MKLFLILYLSLCCSNVYTNQQEFVRNRPEIIRIQQEVVRNQDCSNNFTDRNDTVTMGEIEKIETVEMTLPEATAGEFKSYMSYTSITNTESQQYKMQEEAWTNEDGFRVYNDKYMVAMGTYYAQECGEEFIITLEDGKEIEVVIGDIKQDAHTDYNNQYVEHNGNIVEFIVDMSVLDDTSKKMGDVSYSGLEGAIVKIEKIIK